MSDPAPHQALRDAHARLREALDPLYPDTPETHAISQVRQADLAALLAERDALAAVAEAGLREAIHTMREEGEWPDDGYWSDAAYRQKDGEAEVARWLVAAYDRAVSKP